MTIINPHSVTKRLTTTGGTEYDEENPLVLQGAYMGAIDHVPLDAGLNFFFMSLEYAFEEMGMVPVEPRIFADNRKAVKMEKFFGYKRLIDQVVFYEKMGNRKSFCYAIMREEWQLKRQDLLDIL